MRCGYMGIIWVFSTRNREELLSTHSCATSALYLVGLSHYLKKIFCISLQNTFGYVSRHNKKYSGTSVSPGTSVRLCIHQHIPTINKTRLYLQFFTITWTSFFKTLDTKLKTVITCNTLSHVQSIALYFHIFHIFIYFKYHTWPQTCVTGGGRWGLHLIRIVTLRSKPYLHPKDDVRTQGITI